MQEKGKSKTPVSGRENVEKVYTICPVQSAYHVSVSTDTPIDTVGARGSVAKSGGAAR
jgi:hypothetical protein